MTLKRTCSKCGAEMCDEEIYTGDICQDCARVDDLNRSYEKQQYYNMLYDEYCRER
jgi:reverse gyrase